MLVLLLGIGFIIVGAKALTPSGFPITKYQSWKGPGAKVAGVVCLVLGGACIALSLF